MQTKSSVAASTIVLLDKYLGHTFSKFIRNSSWMLTANLGSSAIHFVQTLLIARWLGAEQFGLLTLVMTYNMLINNFIDLRMWETTTRYVAKFWVSKDYPRTLATVKLCYLIDASTGLLGFSVIWLLAPWLTTIFAAPPEAIFWLRLYSLALLAATLNSTSEAILRVFDKFSWLAWQAMAMTLFQAATVFLLYFVDQISITTVINVYIISELVGGLVLLAMSLTIIRTLLPGTVWGASLRLLQGTYGEIGNFLWGSNLTSWLKTSGGYFEIPVLGYFADPAQVGYYRLAKNMVALISRISEPFYQAIYPELVKSWSNNQRLAFLDLIRKATLLLSGITGVILLALMALSPFIIRMIAGEQYLPAVGALRILAVATALQFVFTWLHPAALSVGRPVISNTALVARLVVQALGAFTLAVVWGVNGMALSTTLSTLAWIAVSLVMLRTFWLRSGVAPQQA